MKNTIPMLLSQFPAAKPNPRIAVVIPAYRVANHIVSVVASIPPIVERIYVVDDACPDYSGKVVEAECQDSRIRVLRHEINGGVGCAVMTAYQAAIKDGMEIIVKIDGDGQMDASLIPEFVMPILLGEADYTKGNRFYNLEEIRAMPSVRLFGNAVLSFLSKLSSGYWNLFDPTNGLTAIHVEVAKMLPFEKISQRYFFESDMLFRLNTIRAVVVDIPMTAQYGNEVSNLKVSRVIGEFFIKHASNFFKRIFYNYYLRDLSLASIELPFGIILILFGLLFGAYRWWVAAQLGIAATAGTVMIAALPIFMGLQFLLAFVGYDISSIPTRPRHIKFNRQLMSRWPDVAMLDGDKIATEKNCELLRENRSKIDG